MGGTRSVRGAEKRERLVEGGRRLVYRQGVARTTLADVAAATGVSIGNIYYYFPTKDELVDAIVAAHAQDRVAMLTAVQRRRSPRTRLKALLELLDGTRDAVAESGCPIGTLSSELDKRCGTEASAGSRELLGSVVDWAERQFREMGQPDPRDLAVTLVAAYEGAAMLTHSLRDPHLLHRQSRRLQHWIDALADGTAAPVAS